LPFSFIRRRGDKIVGQIEMVTTDPVIQMTNDDGVSGGIAVTSEGFNMSSGDTSVQVSEDGPVLLTPAPSYGIKFDTSGTMPTAEETYRGQLFIVYDDQPEGKDRVYICLKSASDNFNWVEIARG